jgi:hypothetical protein
MRVIVDRVKENLGSKALVLQRRVNVLEPKIVGAVNQRNEQGRTLRGHDKFLSTRSDNCFSLAYQLSDLGGDYHDVLIRQEFFMPAEPDKVKSLCIECANFRLVSLVIGTVNCWDAFKVPLYERGEPGVPRSYFSVYATFPRDGPPTLDKHKPFPENPPALRCGDVRSRAGRQHLLEIKNWAKLVL